MIRPVSVEIFDDPVWQMTLGERAAVEGVLAQLRPSLAIEIGSMEGACLRRIAAHAGEVHSFDLQPPSLAMPDNVVVHTGDSHALLAPFLAELAAQGRNVDFVLVDGDHSAQGVRQDIEDLLDSRATGRTIILIHDTTNEEVRRGLDAVHFAAWPKVEYVELDWVPGQLFTAPGLNNELWSGLGLVVADASGLAYLRGSVYQQRYHPAAYLLARARDLALARELVPSGAEAMNGDPSVAHRRIEELEAELGARASMRQRVVVLEAELAAARQRSSALEADLAGTRRRAETLERELVAMTHRHAGSERALEDIKASASWRMTEPVRGAKRMVRRRAD